MLQLICHHTYDTWEGVPVDRSPYGLSSGVTTGPAPFSPDGATPGSGRLRMAPGSFVSVPLSAAWRALGSLRVEVVARLDQLPVSGSNRMLVDGRGSFALYVQGDQLFGVVRAVGDGSESYVSAGGVPFGQWVHLGLAYDGFATLRLTIDGSVVGRARATLPLQPVDDHGLTIGAVPGGGLSLHGDLDEVRIWRHDPATGRREVLGRPLDGGATVCWRRATDALARIQTGHPAALRALRQQIEAALLEQLRRAAEVPSAALEALQGIAERQSDLWNRDALDTDAMEAVFGDLVAWWRQHVGSEIGPGAAGPGLVEGTTTWCGGQVDLSCDPRFVQLLARIDRAMSR